MSSYFLSSRLCWEPINPGFTRTDFLRRFINKRHGLALRDYHDLHEYSTRDYNFWLDLWIFLGIISSIPPDAKQIIAKGKLEEVPNWFPTVRFNYAENLLRRQDDGIACTAGGESGVVKHYTFRQLRCMVAELAAALRVSGLRHGDRVAGIVTNSISAVVIALATTSIGAIFSSTATDMGIQGILERYRQIRPKFIFAETEVVYSGKTVNLLPKVAEVVKDLTHNGLQQAILLPSSKSGADADSQSVHNSITLARFIATGDGRPLEFEQFPFNHPLFILYSSGTSGPPKCIVHCAGGVLLQTAKDLAIGFDLKSDDTYLQYTTTGWMMWTFMLSAWCIGARIILYDGSPFHPNIPTFLKFIDQQGVSVFGTSPRFLTEVQGQGIDPLKLGSFEALRFINCTGAVLTPPVFEWAQDAFGKRVHLASTSGGTDICAAFVTSQPSLPTHIGEIQCKSLGMKVEIFDLAGNNIEHTGEPGELVCTRPHPSLPIGFWGDSSGEKYRKAYYEMFPGIWRHGDFILLNPSTQGFMILGRSDGVLNPSGVRFGSGEIYTILESKFSAVLDDSLCIGQRRSQDEDERVLLFLKLRKGQILTESLVNDIKSSIKQGLSARHVPAYIFAIDDIPYTVNGKKIEIAVKQIVSGSAMKPSGTVANPESLQLYYKYRDLENLIDGKERSKL